jgi:hypothetical protein
MHLLIGRSLDRASNRKGLAMRPNLLSLSFIMLALGGTVPSSRADEPLALHWGSDWRKMSRKECATKAVEAMGTKENFIHAEIDGDGDAFGYTEHASAVVYSVPLRDGVEIYVVVAGKDSTEAARLRNAIRSHVFDGPYNPKGPAKIVSKDAKRKSAAPAIHLGADSRPLSRSEFSLAASTSLQRQGMRTSVENEGATVAGAKAGSEAAAFYLQTKPGTGYISVVAASYDTHQAERLRNVVREDIFSKKLPKPWAILLCKFSDLPTVEPHPVSFYQDCFTELGAGKGREFDYFREVSYGTLDMTGSKVFGWFTMPNRKTKDLASLKYPSPGRATLHDWGIELAKAHKIDLTAFHGVAVVFNFATDSGAAGGHRVVLGYDKKDWSPTFNLHELGHGFDLNHSWSARPDVEYGDPWDIMSAMRVFTVPDKFGQATGPGMNACNLQRLGCIGDNRIWHPKNKTGTETFTLAALNRPEANGYLMASIPPAAGSASKTSYVIEFRQKKGWDAGIARDAVLVHEVRSDGTCYLLSRNEVADSGSVKAALHVPHSHMKTALAVEHPKAKNPIETLPDEEFSIPVRHLTIRVLSFDAAASTAKLSITLAK